MAVFLVYLYYNFIFRKRIHSVQPTTQIQIHLAITHVRKCKCTFHTHTHAHTTHKHSMIYYLGIMANTIRNAMRALAANQHLAAVHSQKRNEITTTTMMTPTRKGETQIIIYYVLKVILKDSFLFSLSCTTIADATVEPVPVN